MKNGLKYITITQINNYEICVILWNCILNTTNSIYKESLIKMYCYYKSRLI